MIHQRGYGSFDEDRVMLLASSSKMITAGVLIHLSDAGLLDLDAPITDVLSDWGQHKEDITTAQLLSNSSGMPGLGDGAFYGPYLCQFVAAGSLASCAEAIYGAVDGAESIPPDTRFRYGGAQWQLAGGIAEVASGQSWEDLINDIYSEPCGLENTGYTNHFGRAAATDAFGYPAFMQGDVNDLPESDNPNMEGGGYSTASDYAKLLMMHLNDGMCGETQVLSAEGASRSRTDRIGPTYDGTTGAPGIQGYGMGWWIDTDRSGWAIDGGAYGAMPWIDTETGYAVILLLESNNQTGNRLQQAVQDIVHDAIIGSPNL
ncbi:MAG: CubicO group peptidase (beta-lactamase class C family) [Myxococcota bacterium]